jgi:hypothetical protein
MNPDPKHCFQEDFALDSTESDGQEGGVVLEIESDDEEEVAIVTEEEQVEVVDPIQELDNLFNSSHEVSWSARLLYCMDKGTFKTPIPFCRLYCSFC